MATFTGSGASSPAVAKSVYSGETVLRIGDKFSGVTPSDILLLATIPNGAIVTDLYGRADIGGNADLVLKLGWRGQGSVNETAFGTHTFSSTTSPGAFDIQDDVIGAQKVSFSDSTGEQNAFLFATVSSGSGSDTVSLNFVLRYHVDHKEGV